MRQDNAIEEWQFPNGAIAVADTVAGAGLDGFVEA
jgi:hypothetical protein